MIVTQLNEGFAPPARTLGSVGQGDLGPMADLAHGLLTRSGYQVAENEGLAWSAATPSPRPRPASPPPTPRP
jgi:histidine ammonia-lyase